MTTWISNLQAASISGSEIPWRENRRIVQKMFYDSWKLPMMTAASESIFNQTLHKNLRFFFFQNWMKTKEEPRNRWEFSKGFQLCLYIICIAVNIWHTKTNTWEGMHKHSSPQHALTDVHSHRRPGGQLISFAFNKWALEKRKVFLKLYQIVIL